MPVQTTSTENIFFPDGAVVGVKVSGDSVFTDVGAINSAVTATLNYTENQVETANAGKTAKQIKEMEIEGGFTLINLNPVGVEKLGGSLFTKVDTAGTPISTIPDKTVSAGWADQTRYPLDMVVSSSDSTPVRTTAAPTITSVTLDPSGTPEVLAEDTEYIVVADTGSSSGWSIVFISANMTTGSPTTFDIEIVYGTNTPLANSIIYAGTSTTTLTAYALQITHTDSAGKIRRLDLYSVDPNTGGFQFNFKGANEDGVEEMPLTYTAKIDTSLTDGRQLLAWTIEDGAQ